ncbi:MAG: PspA-associated protein PspAA [Solirubrobacteraceae bacterium]
MIVRIATEAQYELGDGDTAELNELDNAAVAACESGDERRFGEAFARLLELVRTKGAAVRDDELVGSDIILPPPDVSLEEARSEFQGEGLIPG